MRDVRRLKVYRWFEDTFVALAPEPGTRPGFGAFEVGLLLVSAIALLVMWFPSHEASFLELLRFLGLNRYGAETYSPEAVDGLSHYEGAFPVRAHPFYPLVSLWYWVFCCVAGYVLVPVLYLRLCGRRLSDYCLGVQGFLDHASVYAGLCLVVLVLVIWASAFPSFQEIYPFYPNCGRSYFDLVAWELGYGVQFVALEFFFRAFLLEGLRRSLGAGAVFVAVVPYCMLHFQKTWLESVGSIVAGVVLGLMAMRFRSIWGGVLVHWFIAVSMDIASLVRKGEFPPTDLHPF